MTPVICILQHFPQKFAAPGTCKEVLCGGRPCVKCHKCRDWHFTGNQDQWNWVCNYENWTQVDKERWLSIEYKLFTKRHGATCNDDDRHFNTSAALIRARLYRVIDRSARSLVIALRDAAAAGGRGDPDDFARNLVYVLRDAAAGGGCDDLARNLVYVLRDAAAAGGDFAHIIDLARDLIHSLRHAAATYGRDDFARIGDLARNLIHSLRDAAAAGSHDDAGDFARIDEHVYPLVCLIRHARDPDDALELFGYTHDLKDDDDYFNACVGDHVCLCEKH
ncbi:unnamed protein product [Adineta steineri]|uniref:Uncharacterized protein n=1 Tax=Adineta steineri TaxID=433720 RepID=A0A818M1Z6_9BILA|nr:unnamed protein product [Adineta steineri]